ncbi:MAG: tetratricopeptide repeat protein [Desulfobacteraceae bacterium]|jgi:tetratricopeptide (TPR) repeat protein
MRINRKKILQMLSGLCLLLGAVPGLQAADQFVYEQRDEAAEKKRYVVQLEKDKRKCELAIINTKTLIGRSKNRPYLPDLYLRLAELYIEKSRMVYFLRRSRVSEGGERALDQYEANVLKQRAIEIYQRILNDHPNFGHTDKVHFFMAHEFRELGRIDEMITQYQTIISAYPESQYCPESHLLLGDYFFNKKQDVDQSKAHYESVLQYPQSSAVAAARYKLAWCQINLLDYKGALELFEESVNSPQAAEDLDIDTYRRVDVRLESLIDMAYCYPEVYKKATPEQALEYFKQYAWSRPVYTTVLEKLAYRYYVKKKWSMTAQLYRELATIRQDPEKLIEYAKLIFESAQAIGKYQHAEKDVSIIIKALASRKYSVHVPQADKDKLLNDFEIYARDIITHLHAKSRQSNSAQDFTIAANAYKQYLDFFGDTPAAVKMAENYAEALFSAGKYLEAGKQYEKVLPEATVNTKKRKEMLYSTVISYYQALKNKQELNFYQAAYARDGLRANGKIFAGEYPHSPHTPDILFNVAWVSYDAGQYDAAIADLSNFVDQYTNHKAAKAAVHLVLDAYHLLEDYDGMIRYGKTMLTGGKIRDPKLRQEIAQIVRSAESKVVSTMTMAAMDDWENKREELMQVADRGGLSGMGEQALNALIITSEDQNDLPTLYNAGNKMIKSFPKSTHTKNTLGILINTSVKIGQLRLVGEYMEQFAQRYPKDQNSADFLMQAAHIREGVGQYTRANQNYQRLIAHGGLSADQFNEVVFAMADNMEKIGNKDAALRTMRTYQSRLSPQGRVRAQASMAVISLQANRRSQAQKYSRAAKQAYKPSMGKNDPVLHNLMAQIAYEEVYGTSGRYYKLKLSRKIDNKIVAQKSKLLQTLEEGYQKVMGMKSPAWALRACFRANELNREFAEFLLQSPLPGDLTAVQKQQYSALLRQKAQAYTDKADQYLKTCVELAKKWEICDPKLFGYFYPASNPQGQENAYRSLSGDRPSVEISRQALRESDIAALYRKLLKSSNNQTLQLELAKAYLKHGDYRQASLIAKSALPKLNGDQRQLKADLLNVVGLTHLYCGRDALAKETFKQALEADQKEAAARINLAGLYKHYGHGDKAAQLISGASLSNIDRDAIHPQIGANINEYVMQAR